MGYGGEIDGYINAGRRIGRKEWLQEGIEKGIEDAIKLMLKKKISSLSEIVDDLDMPPSEVEAIANRLKALKRNLEEIL